MLLLFKKYFQRTICLGVIGLMMGCSNTTEWYGPIPNLSYDGKADAQRIGTVIAQQDQIEKERQQFTSAISDYEQKSKSSSCKEFRFAGFDGDPKPSGDGTKRAKASAFNSCGISYYWMTLREGVESFTIYKIERRVPKTGDKVWTKNSQGRWELNTMK